jgi:hypothetical protein
LGSCHGPAGGAPAAGVGGEVPTERIPRENPPNLARRGEIGTKTQKLRTALSCEPLPNQVVEIQVVEIQVVEIQVVEIQVVEIQVVEIQVLWRSRWRKPKWWRSRWSRSRW